MFSHCVCVGVCTDARVGGLSGRRGGWEEEEEELVFGGRGFLGSIDGREGLRMSPAFPSSPTHTYKHNRTRVKQQKIQTNDSTEEELAHTQSCSLSWQEK